MSVKHLLEYEVAASIEFMKRIDTWMFLTAFATLFAAIWKNYNLAIVLLFIMIILQLKRDYDSGEITDYIRRQMKIPSPSQIQKWKEQQRADGQG